MSTVLFPTTRSAGRWRAPARRTALPSPALRRLAFRALLPAGARRLVVLGADQSLVRAARLARIAETVDAHLGSPASADQIVVLAEAARPDLSAVVGELAPGGTVWWETDRRRRSELWRSPGRVARSLTDHGLVVTDSFLLRPDPSRAEWYVPLSHPRALRWFVDNLYAPASMCQVLGEVVVRAVTRSSPRFTAGIAPFHAVVAHRPSAADLSAPVARATRFVTDDGATMQARLAMVGHGGDRAVVLGFEDGAGSPSFVAKIADHDFGARSLLAEHAAILDVRRHVGHPLATTIPAGRVVRCSAGISLVQDVMPGRSLGRSLVLPHRGLDAKIAELHAVVRWIGDLHAVGAGSSQTWDDRTIADVDAGLDRYATRFHLSTVERRMLDLTRVAARTLSGARVPRVWEHGDLTPWNVVLDGLDVRILDWEVAQIGLPLLDVLRITDHWHAAVLRMHGAQQRALARCWLVRPRSSPHRATRAAREAVDGYMARLGLPRGLEDVLHVVGLATLAVRQDDRRHRAGQRSGDRTSNIPAVQLASLAHVLVDGGLSRGGTA